MDLFPVRILATNERGVVFHLGTMTRVVGPGLVWLVPVVDTLVVLNLDQVLPDWGGLSQIELNRMVRFIVETYSEVPSNLSSSQIRDAMRESTALEGTTTRSKNPQYDSSPWAGASVLWGLATVVVSAFAGVYLIGGQAGELVGYLCWVWGFFVWLAASLYYARHPRPPSRVLWRTPAWFGEGQGQFPGPSGRIAGLEGATTRSTVGAIIAAIIIFALIAGFAALFR
jgi:hypothetical protein